MRINIYMYVSKPASVLVTSKTSAAQLIRWSTKISPADCRSSQGSDPGPSLRLPTWRCEKKGWDGVWLHYLGCRGLSTRPQLSLRHQDLRPLRQVFWKELWALPNTLLAPGPDMTPRNHNHQECPEKSVHSGDQVEVEAVAVNLGAFPLTRKPSSCWCLLCWGKGLGKPPRKPHQG